MADQELALDLEELRHLQSIAKRHRIISHLNLLSKHLLFTELLNSEKEQSPPQPPPQPPKPQAKSVPQNTVVVRKQASGQEQGNSKLNIATYKKSNWRPQNTVAKKQVPKQEQGNSQLNLDPNEKSNEFSGSMTIPQFRKEFGGLLKDSEHRQDITESLLGQITDIRSSSFSRIIFFDLQSGASKVQVMADPSNSEMDETEFFRLHSYVRRGDFVGVTGFPGKSNRGKLSLISRSLVVLSNSQIHPSQKADSTERRAFPSYQQTTNKQSVSTR